MRGYSEQPTETILLYGSTTWSLTKAEENKNLDGTYTRMLLVVKNIFWKGKIKNRELYGSLGKLNSTIQNRRVSLPGHVSCYESSPGVAADTLM